MRSVLKFLLWPFLLFAVLAVALYWPAHTGGWLVDDHASIVRNVRLLDLSEFIKDLLFPRSMAFLSFALDVHWWGLDASSSRWVNVAIHVVNALLVVLLFRWIAGGRSFWALMVGLFFLLHPVQTSTVNYVVQRMALLGCFFTLGAMLSVCGYFHLLSDRRRVAAAGALLAAFICSVLALFSKENTVLMCGMVPLLAWRFGQGRLAPGWKYAFGVLALLPVLAVFFQLQQGMASFEGLVRVPLYRDAGARYYEDLIDRSFLPLRYLLSQAEVFWVYVALLFFPVRQAFDYSWPIPDLTPAAFLPLLATGTVLVALGWVAFRNRDRYPLSLLGLGWVATSMVVESSVIPLDPIFEHRLYLPLFGVALILFEQVRMRLSEKGSRLFILLFLVALAALSWQRNFLWGDTATLLRDNCRVVPRALRPQLLLAQELFRQKDFVQAANVLDGLETVRDNVLLRKALGETLLLAGEQERATEEFLLAYRGGEAGNDRELFRAYKAINLGQLDVAEGWLQSAGEVDRGDPRVHYFRGQLEEKRGRFKSAFRSYGKTVEANRALTIATLDFRQGYAEWAASRRREIWPEVAAIIDRQRAQVLVSGEVNAKGAFANELLELRLTDEAIRYYEELKETLPDYWPLHYNLGMAYRQVGAFSKAEASYRESLRLSPGNRDVLLNLGMLLLKRGQVGPARKAFEDLLVTNPGDVRGLLGLGRALMRSGEAEQARPVLLRAAQVPGYGIMARNLLAELEDGTPGLK